MPKQSRPDEQKPGTPGAPNQASQQEQAEGSRENVNTSGAANERGSGITNRPLDEEQREQDQLPPRGTNKGGSHA